jgi:hypothetical protein
LITQPSNRARLLAAAPVVIRFRRDLAAYLAAVEQQLIGSGLPV